MPYKKHRQTAVICTLLFVWGILTLLCWLHKPQEFSESERRKLAQFPALTSESVLSGDFSDDFNLYTQDQFPFREQFRRLKSIASCYLLQQKDIHNIYIQEGSAAALTGKLSTDSLDHAADIFERIYTDYLQEQDMRIFTAIIPDKNYYLADSGHYPHYDYDELYQYMERSMPYASFIELRDTLSAGDYYRTDSHWKQNRILPAADRILSGLSAAPAAPENYQQQTASDRFYGVYYGQAALPMGPDSIDYLTCSAFEQISVYNYETGKTTGLYDFDKLSGKDPYDFFLSGASPLLLIRNPDSPADRRLIIFRDSFGSSMAPLLARNYQEILLVDCRYIASGYLPKFINFQNWNGADVLFLYSTTLLNESGTLK